MSFGRRSHLSRKYSSLQYLHLQIDWKFDPIKTYLDSTQGMIAQYEKNLEKNYKAWEVKQKANPELPDAFDVFESEIIHGGEFSEILNQSIYLTTYSIFEKELHNICDQCKDEENLKIGVKDLSGRNYIAQCMKYLKLVIKINLDALNDLYQEISFYQKLRNVFAHNNGFLKSIDVNMQRFIDSQSSLTIDKKSNKVNFESIDFVKDFIDKATGFLIELGEEIQRQKNT